MESLTLEAFAAQVADALARRAFPWFDPERGETVLEPDAPGHGHWVGAPSVVADGDRVLLGYRRRRPRDGSVNERGHLAAVAESRDGGRTFRDLWRVTKQEVGTSSLERLCLRRAPGGWRLYTSWEDPPASGRWRVDVLEADDPARFEIATARALLRPAELGVDAVKDPYASGARLFVSTFLTPDGPAPTGLASTTGEWRGEALGVGPAGRWDAYQARLSCVLAFGPGEVGYYDGAAGRAEDTEERCGVACSLDGEHWRSATPAGPALVSPHATGSLRYVDVVDIADATWAYYEYARADCSHELRRNRLDR